MPEEPTRLLRVALDPVEEALLGVIATGQGRTPEAALQRLVTEMLKDLARQCCGAEATSPPQRPAGRKGH